MLVDLYPRVHRRYSSLAIIGPILDGYGTWLLKQGYSTEREAGLLNRTRPRAFPGGAAPRPRSTATRRPGPDEPDTGAIVGLCSQRFAGGSQFGGPGAAAGAVLRVRAGAVSAARVDPDRAASRRLQDGAPPVFLDTD